MGLEWSTLKEEENGRVSDRLCYCCELVLSGVISNEY